MCWRPEGNGGLDAKHIKRTSGNECGRSACRPRHLAALPRPQLHIVYLRSRQKQKIRSPMMSIPVLATWQQSGSDVSVSDREVSGLALFREIHIQQILERACGKWPAGDCSMSAGYCKLQDYKAQEMQNTQTAAKGRICNERRCPERYSIPFH